jgi:hypothetical protein
MIFKARGAVCAIESMRHPCKLFSLMFFESAATQFCKMISEPRWALCAVESMRNPWKQFRWWFLRLDVLFAPLESMHHPWKHFRWCFLRPQGLIALSNSCITRESSVVDDFWGHRGCLRCPMLGSPVEAVSLMISKTKDADCAIESMRHPW